MNFKGIQIVNFHYEEILRSDALKKIILKLLPAIIVSAITLRNFFLNFGDIANSQMVSR